MTPTSCTAAALASRARRRRRPRASASDQGVLDALGSAEQSACQLADDLAALVQAGLLSPVHSEGELRFAVAEPAEGGA